MYRIKLNNVNDKYDYNELVKIFLQPDQYELYGEGETLAFESNDIFIEINHQNSEDKNHIKREIFNVLKDITGKRPPWGILTGVRPVKLTREIFEKLMNDEQVSKKLKEEYLLSEEKSSLIMDIYHYQQSNVGKSEPDTVGIYIGIPFCPTRCLYCSFTSNQKDSDEIDNYLKSLYKEIEYCGRAMREHSIFAESIYIGGGTPTTLTHNQLDELLIKIKNSFDLTRLKEFTVEAGRPDTITSEKLKVIANHGIKRISINPQTMKDKTLELIGRSHNVEDIKKAFKIACEQGDFIINADLIAGLPNESSEDFRDTLKEVIALAPSNITVHTLAVKKASKLIEADENYHYKQSNTVETMLDISKDMLSAYGYRPYYLYRQKHMAGALENVGYCKGDTPCIYNIRIMDESQSILAIGAGGISKKYYPAQNRLERVPNVSNYQIYMERLDEMIERKRKNFFEEV